MSWLRSTFELSRQTALPASVTKEDVLRILHDHSAMITLNPIVIKHQKVQGPVSPPPKPAEDETTLAPEPDDIFASATSAKYDITDRISYLPGHLWDSSITFAGWFADTADGLRSFVQAPLGVEVRGSWRVYSAPAFIPDGSGAPDIYLVEESTIYCNSLLRAFIRSTMEKSHETLHQRLIERLVGGYGGPHDNVHR